ncbi:pyruvate, phosphate dikinase [Pikeienuella piscinae]|uniref:Pyruvate, phosphate dikinase n=1 Tax=Pikeienuella piscinae TaxID=2748098 RepID=A0A7L5BT50_9RHOB|nr:pyruvate, phosphate dikinase [Pikeienuella piscinae]QIE54665.1 pyruvate, phosphate dikinase [Pikeienuella piscinae]
MNAPATALAEVTDAARHGAKAARLARLIAAGAPVPPGFAFPDDAAPEALAPALAALEAQSGLGFGAPERPLLLALRSSPVETAAPSSPAILNIGLTRDTLPGLAARVGDRAAADLRRRLIQAFAPAAMGADAELFESLLYDRMKFSGVESEDALSLAALKALETEYLAAVEEDTGERFPEDARAQLSLAIAAMRTAWAAPTARILRGARGLAPDSAQALIAQTMTLGVGPGSSGAGFATTRSEEDGAPGFQGRYLAQAQGEDALMGLRTPRLLTEGARREAAQTAPSLEAEAPDAATKLEAQAALAELTLGDACRVEFTLEAGELHILDAQPLRPTARGAVRIAVDLAEAGVIGREAALLRIDPSTLTSHLHPTVSARAPRDVIGAGLPASPGAATGAIVFSSEAAETLAAREQAAILVRVETSPEDIRGMHAASGVLTARGGMTSHAAVIARGLGAPCVVGASDITLDIEGRTLTTADGRVLHEGDIVTIDGSAGEALAGSPELVQPEISGAFAVLMKWADEVRRMKVRANADTAQDAKVAIGFNVDGIGLCRTEHMFFEKNRITTMRRMILAADEHARRAALAELLPMQRSDFIGLFEIMAGLPVTIRLLDPPLHEFLPHGPREMNELAEAMGLPLKVVTRRAAEMREFNPMLGNRGCRVGVTYPEIYEMQARAVFEAAVAAGEKTGEPVIPEIMIPLVSANREMELLERIVERVAEQVRGESGAALCYRIGAMVETPRAALRAGDLAATAEFLSFGTNDLTQMTYGLSRDDAGRFMRDYVAKGVYPEDPFHTLDVEGVGELILLAAERGRARAPGLTLGLCGEHGGDPASIRFCELARFDYISCSPFRLPIARLAAAQARLLSPDSS